jgi:hypothetical protein
MTNLELLRIETKTACAEIGYEYDSSVVDLLAPALEYEGFKCDEQVTPDSAFAIHTIIEEWKEETKNNWM